MAEIGSTPNAELEPPNTTTSLSESLSKIHVLHKDQSFLSTGKQKTHKSKPMEINVYTKRGQRLAIGDRSGLRRLNTENTVGQDLLLGFQNFKPETPEEIYNLADILRVVKKPSGQALITQRRSLLKLMLLPMSSAKFKVVFWNDLIFLVADEEKSFVQDTRYQYAGFRFEDVATEASGDKSRFYSVLHHEIGDLSLYYSAEVDAEDDEGYVELKTHNNKLPVLNWRRKLLSTWCQIYLNGTKNVIVGYRSNNFRVARLKRFSLNEISALFDKMPLFVHNTRLTPLLLVGRYRKAVNDLASQNNHPPQPKQYSAFWDYTLEKFVLQRVDLTLDLSMYNRK